MVLAWQFGRGPTLAWSLLARKIYATLPACHVGMLLAISKQRASVVVGMLLACLARSVPVCLPAMLACFLLACKICASVELACFLLAMQDPCQLGMVAPAFDSGHAPK